MTTKSIPETRGHLEERVVKRVVVLLKERVVAQRGGDRIIVAAAAALGTFPLAPPARDLPPVVFRFVVRRVVHVHRLALQLLLLPLLGSSGQHSAVQVRRWRGDAACE